MSTAIKEELKERVLAFIEAQPGYNADDVEEVTVRHNYNNTWSVLYGERIESGIVGIGDSPDDAFDDFIVKWKFFKGFEWIRKAKMLSHI